MPWFVYISPFIPFIAMLPPAVAAMWIANRWLRSREGGSQIRTLREGRRELPKP